MINKMVIRRIIPALGIIIPISILLLPEIGLIYRSLFLSDGSKFLSLLIPTSRSLSLLGKSVLLSMAVSAASMILGLLASFGLFSLTDRYKKTVDCLCYASVFMLLLPTFIHSQTWWKLFAWAGLPVSGTFPVIWVSLMYYLPLPTMILYFALRSLDKEIVNAGTLFLGPYKVVYKILLPSVTPALISAGLIVFLLSVSDFSIASIFSVNVYALDILAQFSVSGSAAAAFFYTVPLAVIIVIPAMAGLHFIKNLTLTSSRGKTPGQTALTIPKGMKILAGTGLCLLIISMMAPCIMMIASLFDFKSTVMDLGRNIDAFSNTTLVSCIAMLVSLPLSGMLGLALLNKRVSGLLYTILAISLIMPSPLIGIGLIGVFNQTTLYNTVLMPVLAALIRFLPISAIICYGGLKSLNQDLIAANRLFQKSAFNGFTHLTIPMILPFVLLSALFIFILSTGEIGATLMVSPAGFNTLAIKMYNYLHYGASNTVAVLCLALVGLSILVSGVGALCMVVVRKGRY